MGFSEVVLCGMPLEKGGLYKEPSRPFQDQRIVDAYRAGVLADTEWHDDVRSMSGWTREVFGE